jgi:hypothetical protein
MPGYGDLHQNCCWPRLSWHALRLIGNVCPQKTPREWQPRQLPALGQASQPVRDQSRYPRCTESCTETAQKRRSCTEMQKPAQKRQCCTETGGLVLVAGRQTCVLGSRKLATASHDSQGPFPWLKPVRTICWDALPEDAPRSCPWSGLLISLEIDPSQSNPQMRRGLNPPPRRRAIRHVDFPPAGLPR